MEKGYLLLGTNLGMLKENLINALKEMEKMGVKILKKSKIYKTKPWGKTDQPDFLNMAIEIETQLSARELLKIIQKIEVKLGRERHERWGPRTIDIDILFYGNKVINETDLVIPHPHFFARPFAIVPMAEIAPDFIPPGKTENLRELVSGVDCEGIEIYRD